MHWQADILANYSIKSRALIDRQAPPPQNGMQKHGRFGALWVLWKDGLQYTQVQIQVPLFLLWLCSTHLKIGNEQHCTSSQTSYCSAMNAILLGKTSCRVLPKTIPGSCNTRSMKYINQLR